jgi:hypothetical protein
VAGATPVGVILRRSRPAQIAPTIVCRIAIPVVNRWAPPSAGHVEACELMFCVIASVNTNDTATLLQLSIAVAAARSVLDQDYRKIELILINDGSTDDISSLQELTQRDERAMLLSKPNGGTASARNLALDRASGEYITFLDADDLWLPGKLTRQIQETYLANADVSYTSFFVTFPLRGLGPVKMPWGEWEPIGNTA